MNWFCDVLQVGDLRPGRCPALFIPPREFIAFGGLPIIVSDRRRASMYLARPAALVIRLRRFPLLDRERARVEVTDLNETLDDY
jgi:hypothetical protein